MFFNYSRKPDFAVTLRVSYEDDHGCISIEIYVWPQEFKLSCPKYGFL
jgi:hypothetical protein